MSKEGTTEQKAKGSKGKLLAVLIVLILVVGGGVYYYNLQKSKINAVFEQLKEQGIVFKEWKKNSDKTYSLIEPKLQVSENVQLNVGSVDVALKDDSLLDVTLKNVTYKNSYIDVTLPIITVSGYKVNKDIFDERLKDKMSPFALHLLSNDFKSMVFENLITKFAFSMEDIEFSGDYKVEKLELFDYYDGVMAKQNATNLTNTLELSLEAPAGIVRPENQTLTFENIQASDVNVRLQALMSYIAEDKADQPFQKVSGPVVIKNYKVDSHQQNSVWQEMSMDSFSMRYGKKAPMDIFSDIVTFAQNATETESVDYPKLFGLIRDSVNIIDMIGPYKQVNKNYDLILIEPPFGINVKIDEAISTYDSLKFSGYVTGVLVEAKDVTSDSTKPYVKAKLDAYKIEGFDVRALYDRTIVELDKLSKMQDMPNYDTYFQKIALEAIKDLPKVDLIAFEKLVVESRIGSVNFGFDEISITNKYATDGPIPTSVDLKVVNYLQFVRELQFLPESLGLSDGILKLSTHIKADWNEAEKQIALHDSFFESNIFGRLDASATFGQAQAYLFSGNLIQMGAGLLGVTVNDVKSSFNDQGMLKKYIEGVASDEEIDEQEVRYALIADYVQQLQDQIEDGDIRATIIAPVAKFINNGGTISINAKSKTNYGVALSALMLYDLSNNIDALWQTFDIEVEAK